MAVSKNQHGGKQGLTMGDTLFIKSQDNSDFSFRKANKSLRTPEQRKSYVWFRGIWELIPMNTKEQVLVNQDLSKKLFSIL